MLFYTAKVQDLLDHILARREREEKEEMKGGSGSQEGRRKEKSLEKEGRKTVDQKTYYNAHTLR